MKDPAGPEVDTATDGDSRSSAGTSGSRHNGLQRHVLPSDGTRQTEQPAADCVRHFGRLQSLRRLAHYSLSPVMKTAFEQVYGAPYLARLLFAEIGPSAEQDLFLRLDCDGSIASAGAGRDPFGAISGTREATQAIETHLRAEHRADSTFAASLEVALDAWAAAQIVNTDTKQAPSREQITKERAERSQNSSVEAALLERSNERAIRYRQLTADEIRSATGG